MFPDDDDSVTLKDEFDHFSCQPHLSLWVKWRLNYIILGLDKSMDNKTHNQ